MTRYNSLEVSKKLFNNEPETYYETTTFFLHHNCIYSSCRIFVLYKCRNGYSHGLILFHGRSVFWKTLLFSLPSLLDFWRSCSYWVLPTVMLTPLSKLRPSPWAFSTRSILDSTVSCDVTERYSQTSRGQRVKREPLGTRLSKLYTR